VEPLSQEQGYRLALARSTANDAIRAVALQRDRVKDRDDDAYFAAAGYRQEVDVAFLLVALRWLREACQLVVELTQNAALAAAVGNFDRRLPSARDLRDVREHIRDYIQGSGKLQRDATPPDRLVSMASLGSRTWLGHDELSHFMWAGKEIRLDDALPAAERLYGAMQEAITPYVVRGSDGQEGIQVQVGSGTGPRRPPTESAS
jgi:hypothetical protein